MNIHAKVKELLAAYFRFRVELYKPHLFDANDLDSLEALQFFVFHMFQHSRDVAQTLVRDASGSTIEWFDDLFDDLLAPSVATTPANAPTPHSRALRNSTELRSRFVPRCGVTVERID